MSQIRSATDTHRRIMEAAGTAVLNRAHTRTFSFNVFRMNAIELIEATHRLKDHNQGLELMLERNRAAGTQAHRELSRHVHNFVSSALTLVEHTRTHMRKHYGGTEFLKVYEAQATSTFAKSPVAQFVQGLRNYMLHRGLPNSRMFMTFTATPGAADGSGTMETGVKIGTASLLNWDGWKPAARAYLETAGEELDVQEFAQAYLALASKFHVWLEDLIAGHHRRELEELAALHSELEAAEPEVRMTTDLVEEPAVLGRGVNSDFATKRSEALDELALKLFEKVRELCLASPPSGFPSERETIKITDLDLTGPATYWGQAEDGTPALAFIRHEGKTFGLVRSDYESLEALVACVMKSPEARESISDEFTENVFLDWARARFQTGASIPFSIELANSVREEVIPVEVWAPIAYMEIEEAFSFGPVRVEPVTAATIERLAAKAQLEDAEQRVEVRQLLDELKRKFQGLAAVLVTLIAEPKMAQERALRLAHDAVGLLRFFSPPASVAYLFSPVSLSGSEYVPIARLILIHETGLTYSEGVLPKEIAIWRLSKTQLSRLQTDLFAAAASLVNSFGLSEFALAVRASLLAYSKSTTFFDPLDRLRTCVSAVEGVLLKHELEPRAHTIANRMALIAQSPEEREVIKTTVRKIYWLQGQPSMHRLQHREEELIFAFTTYAHRALRMALGNSANFASKMQFLDEVDHMYVRSSQS